MREAGGGAVARAANGTSVCTSTICRRFDDAIGQRRHSFRKLESKRCAATLRSTCEAAGCWAAASTCTPAIAVQLGGSLAGIDSSDDSSIGRGALAW